MDARRDVSDAPRPGVPVVGAPQSGAPCVRELRAFVDRVAWRIRSRAALLTAAAGLWISAAVLTIAGVPADRLAMSAISLAIVAVAAVAAALTTARSRARTVADVERRAPGCRNLLVTAFEILSEERIPAYVRTRVLGDAWRLAQRLDVRVLLPHRRPLAAFASGLVAWSAVIALAHDRTPGGRPAPQPSSDRAAVISSVEIEVAPPEYSGQPAHTLRNPSRIDALAGSRLRLTIAADAARLTLDTLAGAHPVESASARTFTTTLVAETDGFLAITPTAATGETGVRRLIGLAVAPDALPRVRATAPGKDLLIASGQQTVPLALDADDDLALASLELRYTKVAGSGETFTFTDGTVPLAITRTNDRAWTAQTRWRLDELGLEPGDMVIYRGIATDRRPGAPPGESETFVIEIAAPGALASEGFAVDDRMDRYAVSQQMVILKTERLLASRASMSADEFKEAAMDIAAEQRQVRAEFMFMLGGELTDAGLDITTLHEEEEAAGEEDLAAGRLINQGRADLMRAIRTMSRAAALLIEPNVSGALPIEKEALVYLQRAFSRSRYILRTLSERERIDLSRRLTGTLAALARPSRPAAAHAPSPRVTSLRQVLVDVAALASDPAAGTGAGMSRAAALAQRLWKIDPAASALRDIASGLAAQSAPDLVERLERAALALAEVIRAEIAAAPARSPDPEAAALAGALADALARPGSRR